MSKKVTRPGAGRTKGSFSFVMIPLKDLNAKIADQTTEIKVSRLFAETLGFKVNSAPANELTKSIEGKAPGSGVETKEVTLD